MVREFGRFKIEALKDGVYHIDENTSHLKAGALDEDGSYNNPSSMYLIINDLGAILVDLAYGAKNKEALFSFKQLLETYVQDRPLTIILTHNHFDHIGFIKQREVFENIHLEHIYISKHDHLAMLADFNGYTLLEDHEVLNIYGETYEFNVCSAHTPGSLFVYNPQRKLLIIGDTFGSGYVWIVFDYANVNPLKTLAEGLNHVLEICGEDDLILAGHRYQQFDKRNAQRPNEMNRSYFLDMLDVLEGLKDQSTTILPYKDFEGAIELSKENKKAKIDTFEKYVKAYLNEEMIG